MPQHVASQWNQEIVYRHSFQASGSLVLKDFGSDEQILIDDIDMGDRAAEFEPIGKSL